MKDTEAREKIRELEREVSELRIRVTHLEVKLNFATRYFTPGLEFITYDELFTAIFEYLGIKIEKIKPGTKLISAGPKEPTNGKA